MAAVVRVHRPNLTPEERERKTDEIRRSTQDFHRKVIKEKTHG